MPTMMEEWVPGHSEWAFFAPEGRRAGTVSALKPPAGKAGRQVVAEVAKSGHTIGAGLDAMADAMVRVGHMGELGPKEFEGLLGGVE